MISIFTLLVRRKKNVCDKVELITPARPIFEPMMTRIHDDFAPYIERKVQSYMEGNVKFGKKNKRVYKVYGG